MESENFYRRDVLTLGGAAVGTVAVPYMFTGVDCLSSQLDGSTSQQARTEIDRFRVSFDNDSALIREAGESASDRLLIPDFLEPDRHEYLFDYFNRTQALYMPAGVKNRITPLMPGLAAQESRFHPDRTSPSGAVTIMQFMPATYRGLGGVLSIGALKQDFVEQVEFAFKYLDEGVYQYLDSNVDFRGLCQKYGVSGAECDEFIALSVINGYKAGQGNMKDVLNGFHEGFLVSSLPPGFDRTGLGLFYVMSNFMSSSAGRHLEPNYGPQSHEYPLKVIAGAESLADKFNQPYGLKVARPELLMAGISAAVGYVLTDAVVAPSLKPGNLVKYPVNIVASAFKLPFSVTGLVRRSINTITGAKAVRTSPEKKPKATKPRVGRRTPSAILNLSRRQVLGGAMATAVLGTGGCFKDKIGNVIGDLWAERERYLEGLYSELEVRAELERWNERGIFITSSWARRNGKEETGTVDAADRTRLEGMRKDVWGTIEQLLEDLDLLDQADSPDDETAIIITGLAEGLGHSERKHGHGNGYAADFRIQSANRIANRLIEDTTVTNRFTRELHPNHRLRESGLVIGDQIFRFNSKYFLFGVQHEGQVFVCYFDVESSHRHMEMIPWEDYNVGSQAEFVQKAQLPNVMRGIWRQEVRDYIRTNL